MTSVIPLKGSDAADGILRFQEFFYKQSNRNEMTVAAGIARNRPISHGYPCVNPAAFFANVFRAVPFQFFEIFSCFFRIFNAYTHVSEMKS